MKNDDLEVDPRQEGRQAQHLVVSDGKPANDNGHQTNEQHSLSNEVAAEVRGKPTVSARKIEANRRNSRKSTGPKTASGKKRVSGNAIRHGFFAKGLLVQHPDAKEDPGEYDDFCLRVREYYRPVGWAEEFRMHEIVSLSWRRRRSLRWESGMIAKALADHSYQRRQSRADELAETESTPAGDLGITDHLLLPSNAELDGLLRYEAMIHRQLNHAIGEIERLQAGRKERSMLANSCDIAKQSQEVL
jgi:hypothetical protein